MKLNLDIQHYIKYFTRAYIMLGLIAFIQFCANIVIFSASLKIGFIYAKEYTILATMWEFVSDLVVFIFLGSTSILLALSSFHFFGNAGRLIDSFGYLLFSTKNGWLSIENIPFTVSIDMHSNPTTKIRFAKQTFVFGLLFSTCLTVSYFLTTTGTAKTMTSKLVETRLMTEKEFKKYTDSSKVAINLYYDNQINLVRKTTNYSLQVAEQKQNNIALLLKEKQNALIDLQQSINELRKEQRGISEKESKIYAEKESTGKIIGGVFEFIVVLCSLIMQILNPKEREVVQGDGSPITQSIAPTQPFTNNQNNAFNSFNTKTVNENLNENEILNESKPSKTYIELAKQNKELTKVLHTRFLLEQTGQKQNLSFSEIGEQFGLEKSKVTNFYYAIREHPAFFGGLFTEVVIDNYDKDGTMEWQKLSNKNGHKYEKSY